MGKMGIAPQKTKRNIFIPLTYLRFRKFQWQKSSFTHFYLSVSFYDIKTTYILYNTNIVIIFAKRKVLTFDKILDDKRLWAVKYDGEQNN